MRKLSPPRLPKAAASIRAGAIQARPAMPIFEKETASRSPASTASGNRLCKSGLAQRFFTRRSLPQRGWKASARGVWGGAELPALSPEALSLLWRGSEKRTESFALVLERPSKNRGRERGRETRPEFRNTFRVPVAPKSKAPAPKAFGGRTRKRWRVNHPLRMVVAFARPAS